MDVKLSPELERKVNERVGGAYGSPSAVVEEDLEIVSSGRKVFMEAEIEDLNHHIDLGLADARRG